MVSRNTKMLNYRLQWKNSGGCGCTERRGMCQACGSTHCLHCAASQQAWRAEASLPLRSCLTDQPLPRWRGLAEFACKMAATMALFYWAAWSLGRRTGGSLYHSSAGAEPRRFAHKWKKYLGPMRIVMRQHLDSNSSKCSKLLNTISSCAVMLLKYDISC